MPKVTVVGAGNVGSTLAFQLGLLNIAKEIVLIDKDNSKAQALALDMSHAFAAHNIDANIKAAKDYRDVKDSEIVVITAGFARKNESSREELLAKNYSIIKQISKNIAKQTKNLKEKPTIIVVTNPVDIMTYLTIKFTGFESSKVFGMAGLLDSTRLRCLIAKKLNTSVENIDAITVSNHGKYMLPLIRLATVKGMPLESMLSKEEIEKLKKETIFASQQILKHGISPYFGPSACTAKICESIIYDKNLICCCSVLLQGHYNINDICLNTPAIIGKEGIKQIIELDLLPEEKAIMQEAANYLKECIEKITCKQTIKAN